MSPRSFAGNEPRFCRRPGCGVALSRVQRAYCSKTCLGEDFKVRMVGTGNPHHKNAGRRTCFRCERTFFSYNKTRKYCSRSCYAASRRTGRVKTLKQWVLRLSFKKPRKPRKWRRGERSLVLPCLKCGKEFKKYKSDPQRFCSYPCYVASGGPFLYGVAASLAMRKYGAKKDANHHEIVAALEEAGAAVLDLSGTGGGCPDILVAHGGVAHLMEIKNKKTGYGKKGLNVYQAAWHARWAGAPVHVVYSVEDALRAIGAIK